MREHTWNVNIAELLRFDQLSRQRQQNVVFRGYEEGPITFLPTYKYDTGTDNYDTSEKQRVPSWTDRILVRGSGIKLHSYYRDELCFSDHKPVTALFDVQVVSVDKKAKARILRDVYSKYDPDNGTEFTNGPYVEPPVAVLLDLGGESDTSKTPPHYFPNAQPHLLNSKFLVTIHMVNTFSWHMSMNVYIFRLVPSPSSSNQCWWDAPLNQGICSYCQDYLFIVNVIVLNMSTYPLLILKT